MNVESFAVSMERNAGVIQQMASGLSKEQATWKPDPTSWSVLEVVNHLHDEECEDFRIRLDIMLHRADQPLPAIDPQAWVADRGYNERDLGESLQAFLHERRESVRWLRTLRSPDWSALYESPGRKMTAGDMFASWIAHDVLHIRQLNKLQWLYTVDSLQPFKADYAGPW